MKIKYIITLLFISSLGWSCTNLDEKVYSGQSANDFFADEKLVTLYSGVAYRMLQPYVGEQSLLTLNLQASDECVVPKNPFGAWGEQRYIEIQTHNFVVSHKFINRAWKFCFDGIATCNQVIDVSESSPFEFPAKSRMVAEMKVLRAFFYFFAIDSWGNVPFSINFADKTYPEQKDRKFVFDFIIKEINDNISLLGSEANGESYGRVTQGVANTILAKMYLNAQQWTGTAMWSEAEAACSKVINSGVYSITDRYKDNFEVYNEGSTENIFVIPYDNTYVKSSSKSFIMYMLCLDENSAKTFNIPVVPWDGFLCQPDFFTSVYEAGDTRRDDTWLHGQQYDFSGKPIPGSILLPDFAESKYVDGRDVNDGARLWKWSYQTDGTFKKAGSCMNNDFAIFRYSDVLLMYAEALFRQGGSVATATDMLEFQKIRTRAGLTPFTAADITEDNLLKERGAELAWEGWRRQDLIRFGKFNDTWWCKPSASAPHTKIFPIPLEQLKVNPNLVQNDGYPR